MATAKMAVPAGEAVPVFDRDFDEFINVLNSEASPSIFLADIFGSVEKAINWFKNYPLPAFDNKTPQDLVSEKRTEALIKYIQSLQAGYTG